MVKVRFTKFGSNSQFGSFAPGDVLACSHELARHLVEDVQCARYLTTDVAKPKDVQVKTITKRRHSTAAD